MAKDDKQTLTPKLRFPEFENTRRWRVGELASFANLKKGVQLSASLKDDSGPFPHFNGGVTNSSHTLQSNREPNTTIISEGGNSCGHVQFIETPFWCGGHCYSVHPKASKNDRFLFYALQAHQKQIMALRVGSGLPNIPKAILEKFQLAVADEPGEQQMVAACLTSLDEVVAAQGRKVEALKAHKQGLMQQLFPREGETLPRLRFPEFRDAPEWENRELGPLTNKVGSGITPLGGDKTYKTSGRPFTRSQNVGWGELLLDDIAFIDEETHASFDGTEIMESDVLLNITGASIGRSAIADSRIVGGNVNQHVCIIRVKREELNPVLLNQFLISERGQTQIDSFQAGGNRQGLNFGQIRSFEIPLPPTEKEQKRIADCLSALDAQIAAETEKLAAFKTHKQALMQQLFPSPAGE
jgi:type I restriction enzyme S subunit